MVRRGRRIKTNSREDHSRQLISFRLVNGMTSAAWEGHGEVGSNKSQNRPTNVPLLICFILKYSLKTVSMYTGSGLKGKSRRKVPSSLGIDLVRGHRPFISHHASILNSTFEMESSTNFHQTAAYFSGLPPEILLCIASFVEPEACLSLLQVRRSCP